MNFFAGKSADSEIYVNFIIFNKRIKMRGYNLTGKRFGNLIVLEMVNEFVGCGNQREYICQCQCDNKTIVTVRSHDLISKRKDNCGCMTRIKQSNAKKKYNRYDLSGEYGIGYTFKNKKFYFDLEDYNKIKNYCWLFHKNKNRNNGYIEARAIKKNKIVRIHRIIMCVKDPKDIIDHISGNTLDNRKLNLRIVTNALNAANHKESKRNTSGVCGVSFRKDTNKWRVRIRENGKEITIGQFDNLIDAAIARMNAEKRIYGEYGRNDWEEKLHDISSSL